jgi:glycosyltransferase involved in cell wall biosynthesis
LKIIHLIRAFDPGGAEKQVKQMVESHHLRNAGIESMVVVLQPGRAALLPAMLPGSFQVFNVWSIWFLPELLSLYRFVRAARPHIVHAHLPSAGLVLALLTLLGLRTCKVYAEHNEVTHAGFSFWLHGWVYRQYRLVMFVSQAVQRSVNERRRGIFYTYRQGTVVYNGVAGATASRKGSLNQPLVVGTVAHFRPVKQIPRMIELFAAMRSRYGPAVRFLLVGDGPDMPQVRNRISELHMEDAIDLTGFLQQPDEAFARMHVFMMTSLTEGMPMSLLEAMQQGCIPVVTNVGGIAEVPIGNLGCAYPPGHEADGGVDYFFGASPPVPLPGERGDGERGVWRWAVGICGGLRASPPATVQCERGLGSWAFG